MAPSGELRVNAGVVWLAGNTVWSTPERIRGEVLTTMRYANRRLPLPYLYLFRFVQENTQKSWLMNCDVVFNSLEICLAVILVSKLWMSFHEILTKIRGNFCRNITADVSVKTTGDTT